MASFVRKVPTASGARAVQIVHKQGRQVVGIEHIGSAHDDAKLALLMEATLSAEEAMAVFLVPDTTTPLGLRDRAMLEVFYSTAIRRAELAALCCQDIDFARGTLFVRRGKGGRDRHVPIGVSARDWVRRYLDEVRPRYAPTPDRGMLFLSATGGRLGNTILSRTVTGYVRAAVPQKRGSCHIFRHSAATLMLDAGADVRHVAELLGQARFRSSAQLVLPGPQARNP